MDRVVSFAKEASLRLAYPLPSPLPRGEGIRLSSPNIFRFTCHLIPNPTPSDFQKPDPLAPWERGLSCQVRTFSGLPAIRFSILHPLIFSNLIPSPRGRGLGRGQRTARFVRHSNPYITHNNESPETPLPPRLLQKPNRVRTTAWAGLSRFARSCLSGRAT